MFFVFFFDFPQQKDQTFLNIWDASLLARSWHRSNMEHTDPWRWPGSSAPIEPKIATRWLRKSYGVKEPLFAHFESFWYGEKHQLGFWILCLPDFLPNIWTSCRRWLVVLRSPAMQAQGLLSFKSTSARLANLTSSIIISPYLAHTSVPCHLPPL